MTFWEMVSNLHPFIQWCALWLIWPPLMAIYALAATPFRSWNRWLRHKNITAQGWPPAHLDADGDFKPDDDKPRCQAPSELQEANV